MKPFTEIVKQFLRISCSKGAKYERHFGFQIQASGSCDDGGSRLDICFINDQQKAVGNRETASSPLRKRLLSEPSSCGFLNWWR